jgi:glycosyltransferase involved in cell wall biosynthesis
MSMQNRLIVYVALGSRRVRAAARHVADLVADGARVVLVIAVPHSWAGVQIPPGVSVHRVEGGDVRRTLRAARRLLLRADGPLRDADLLIAGDPEAMPVAWAVGRRHPHLPVHLEPSPDPARRPAPADLAVVTPWYPSPDDAFAGAFVQAATAAVRPGFDRVAVLHTHNWFYTPKRVTGQLVGIAAERQAARSGGAVVLDAPEGELTRVAAPSAAGGGYVAYAEAQVRSLRATLPTGYIEAPVVHAHTGMLGGVVAVRLARPDARIVVTEHATFLPTVFEQPGTRLRYGAMLARVDVLLCVGRYLFDQLSGYFPEHVNKLRIVPNAIDFDRFTVRPEPPRDLLRWLYVGRMVEHKGVLTLVDGFARIAAQDPDVSLTLVGSGPLEEALDARIAELGLASRIARRPAVPPDQVTALMHEHDLLVHASRLETFGMTVVEAIATGTPVLVARSQGPRETLAGLEHHAGLLIEPSEDPEVIAEGYRTLRARLGTLDLPAARAVLSARYGFAAVAARLHDIYRGDGAPPVAAVPERDLPTDRVVVVTVDPRQADRARTLVDQLTDRGIGVDLVTAEPWAVRPGEPVLVHQLGTVEDRRLLLRLERSVVFGVPVAILSGLQRVAAMLPAPRPEAVVRFAGRVHRRVATATHRRLFTRAYSVVRPGVLWRIACQVALPHLDLARIRRVVVVDPYGVPIGWQLGRRCPNVPVTTSRALPEALAAADRESARR